MKAGIKILVITFLIGLTSSAYGLDLEGELAGEKVTQDSSLEVGGQSEISAVEIAPDLGKIEERIIRKWEEVTQAIVAGDLAVVTERILELRNLEIQGGFSSFEDYSLFLVAKGLESLNRGDRESAGFYGRKALEISPTSPLVLIKSLRLASSSGNSGLVQFYRAIKEGFYNPRALLFVLNMIAYPVLWALTFGLYLVFVLFFATRMHRILRAAVPYFPIRLRGMVTPIIVLAILISPIYFGPLWCLAVWGAALYILIPKSRWLSFFSGFVLLLWASIVPLREHLNTWLASGEIQALLQISTSSFGEVDKMMLERITHLRSNDPFVAFTYGQYLRRRGEYEEATQAFSKAESLLGNQAWTRAQLGLIAFLTRKYEQANMLFQEAEMLGLKDAAFLFNYSKVKFELSDTEAARDYLTRARKRNPELVNSLAEREELLGIRSAMALAEIGLPPHLILSSAVLPIVGLQRVCNSRTGLIMPGCTPIYVGLCGLSLLIWFFLASAPTEVVRYRSYYGHYKVSKLLKFITRVLPGGSMILSGKPASAFWLVSTVIFISMPLIGWPSEGRWMIEAVPGAFYFYMYGVIIFTFVISVFSYLLYEGK